jgi:ceramide glucosyltransferase
VQIICGTRDVTDPAITIVRQVAATQPRHSIECHVDPRVHGPNLKISNLINMTQRARHNTLVLIDSDIEVGLDHLSKMIAELQRPRIGAVTCLYQGVAAGGVWAHLAAMRINTDFLPSVIVAMALPLTHPCFGASIAISRDTLCRIGGFTGFVDYLWDDYAIGEAVRRLGYEVAVAPFAVRHICATDTARDWLADEYRAAFTIRGIDPLGHAGSVITHPLPLALISALLGGGPPANDGRTSAISRFPTACGKSWMRG